MKEKAETKIERYNQLRPTRYNLVENMSIGQDLFGDKSMSLSLTMRSRDTSIRDHLVLSFSKVRNLQFDPDGSEIYFSLLTILPVNDGWEDVRFRVFNDEQDLEFSFFCDDFEAIVIEDTAK